MVDECVLRITVPHTLSSTVACIILKPFPTAFSHADPVSAKASRIQWLASTVKELRQLLPEPVVVRGVADSSGTGIPFVRIICPKNASVKLFKVIAAVKGKLEVILDNKAVHLQLQHAELQAATTEVLLTILTAAGWAALSTTSLISECDMHPTFMLITPCLRAACDLTTILLLFIRYSVLQIEGAVARRMPCTAHACGPAACMRMYQHGASS